jgi:muramoyltetrapeptide carboxypeptidase LdcA involved in peptidoglycan recycling
VGLNEAQAPPRVKPGDAVAIVSPSFGAVGAWPHRAERGRTYLESLGLRVKLMPNAARNDSWASASPEERADDLHTAFADDEVSIVLAAIGGNHSNQLLPLLDFDIIASNPKIFQGYSDNTVLHCALQVKARLATFYGPAFTLALAEYPSVIPYTDRYLRTAWFGDEPIVFEAASEWTEEILDFEQRFDLTRARRMEPSEGWVTIVGGAAEGHLVGGCLETICWHLKGTSFWPDFAGSILMLETSEESPSVEHVDSYLTDLAHLGIFDAIAGLLLARPFGYTREARSQLWDLVRRYTAVPALGNLDCGHTDPMMTLPLGARVRLDADNKKVSTFGPPTVA